MYDAGESQAPTVYVSRVASLAADPERRSSVATPCCTSGTHVTSCQSLSIVSFLSVLRAVMLFSLLSQ